VDHLGHGVNVPRSHNDPYGARTCCGLLCRSPVLSTCCQHRALVGDVVLDGQRFNLAHERFVGDETAVAHMQAKAFALRCCSVLFGNAWGVTGQRCVDADPDVGLDFVGRCLGAAQSDFFLRREDDMNFRTTPFVAQGLHHLNAEPACDAIVQRL